MWHPVRSSQQLRNTDVNRDDGQMDGSTMSWRSVPKPTDGRTWAEDLAFLFPRVAFLDGKEAVEEEDRFGAMLKMRGRI